MFNIIMSYFQSSGCVILSTGKKIQGFNVKVSFLYTLHSSKYLNDRTSPKSLLKTSIWTYLSNCAFTSTVFNCSCLLICRASIRQVYINKWCYFTHILILIKQLTMPKFATVVIKRNILMIGSKLFLAKNNNKY